MLREPVLSPFSVKLHSNIWHSFINLILVVLNFLEWRQSHVKVIWMNASTSPCIITHFIIKTGKAHPISSVIFASIQPPECISAVTFILFQYIFLHQHQLLCLMQSELPLHKGVEMSDLFCKSYLTLACYVYYS